MKIGDWVVCVEGEGYPYENDKPMKRKRDFEENSIGELKSLKGNRATVWLIGKNEIWDVGVESIKTVDVFKTGDKFPKKICNTCHRLLPTEENFSKNQTNQHGIIRRPSCKKCRSDTDKRSMKRKHTKEMKKNRPKPGSLFRCPVCDRRFITDVTAKIVGDHNHHTGDRREFICDSCNTGLGRFKNGKYYLKNALRYIESREKF